MSSPEFKSKSNEEAPRQHFRACKFYDTNFRRPRVYPSRTILIDPPETAFVDDDNYKSKHGAAQWTLGGLGSKRFRLQGKVEGNLSRLRKDKDDCDDDDVKEIAQAKEIVGHSSPELDSIRPGKRRHARYDFKPVVGSKRSRYASLIDEEEEV